MRIHLRNFVRFLDLESLGFRKARLGWAGLLLTMTVLSRSTWARRWARRLLTALRKL